MFIDLLIGRCACTAQVANVENKIGSKTGDKKVTNYNNDTFFMNKCFHHVLKNANISCLR